MLVALTAPSDQDVTVAISPQQSAQMRLSPASLTFPAHTVGPQVPPRSPRRLLIAVALLLGLDRLTAGNAAQEVNVSAEDRDSYSGSLQTRLVLSAHSINVGYDGLSVDLPVEIIEVRTGGIKVRVPAPSSTLSTSQPPAQTALGLHLCRPRRTTTLGL